MEVIVCCEFYHGLMVIIILYRAVTKDNIMIY